MNFLSRDEWGEGSTLDSTTGMVLILHLAIKSRVLHQKESRPYGLVVFITLLHSGTVIVLFKLPDQLQALGGWCSMGPRGQVE